MYFNPFFRGNESNESNSNNSSYINTTVPTLIYYTTAYNILPERFYESNQGNENNESTGNTYDLNSIAFNIYNYPITYSENSNEDYRDDFRNIVNNYINTIDRINNENTDDNNGNGNGNGSSSEYVFEFSNAFIPASSLVERLFEDYMQNKNKLNEEEYTNTTIKLNEKIVECPICFNSYDTSIKIKKCEHIFCEDCIRKWLQDHKNTCPICRTNVLKRTNEEISNEENLNNSNIESLD